MRFIHIYMRSSSLIKKKIKVLNKIKISGNQAKFSRRFKDKHCMWNVSNRVKMEIIKTRNLFLRAIAAVYLFAFCSLYLQIRGVSILIHFRSMPFLKSCNIFRALRNRWNPTGPHTNQLERQEEFCR